MVKGVVLDETNQPLPGTTVYIPELAFGTVTNVEGRFEIDLTPGTYTILFRFLGYETYSQKVQLSNEVVTMDVKLVPRPIVLENVTVVAGNEDPAYTIMRKAIAKASFHRQIVDSYTSTVYMKGKGKVSSIPFLLRNKLKEEGVDTSRLFIGESVSRIDFKRPSNYTETVLSVRSNGDDNNSSPISYITASFYDPEIVETVSPLSPRAFSQYKFELIETFEDQGNQVSRIKVIPKYVGDHLFKGELSIVREEWAIHSIDLQATKLGIDIFIDQVYQPFGKVAWMPVSHKFKVKGSVIGISFSYDYSASAKYENVKINEALNPTLAVVDDKIDKDRAKQLSKVEVTASAKKSETPESLISTKELKKQMKQYEKEEQKSQEEPDVLFTKVYKIDSMAYKRDDDYWKEVRSVPLTTVELKGYRQIDSLAGKIEKDSVKKNRPYHFKIQDPFVGRSYYYKNGHTLRISGLLKNLGYNTVEGINTAYSIEYNYRKRKNYNIPGETRISNEIAIIPSIRYSAERNIFLMNAVMEFNHRKGSRLLEAEWGGGYFIRQLNGLDPILPIVNTAYTLLGERNFMKIYQSKQIYIKASQRISGAVTMSGKLQWEERTPLINSGGFRLIDWKSIDYSSNDPELLVPPNAPFTTHDSFIWQVGTELRPGLKYYNRNGRKIALWSSSPIVNLSLTGGIPTIFNSQSEFLKFEGSISHSLDLGPTGQLNLSINGSKMIQDQSLTIIDYLHFPGNQTIFSTENGYRLLNYYQFSNTHYGVGFHSELKLSRHLFLSAVPFIAKKGIKDFAFFNFLSTYSLPAYFELGYGLDYVFKFMKLELVTSFYDNQFQSVGIRIGIAPEININ